MKLYYITKINNIWEKDKRVELIRRIIIPLIKKKKIKFPFFDELDLENQVLFRATTLPFNKALEHINEIIEEQYKIIYERMTQVRITPDKFFYLGYYRESPKWKLKWIDQRTELYAFKRNARKKVIFQEVPRDFSSDIMENYHYIHCSRNNHGWAFGLFMEGENFPFAITEVEPCLYSRNYKKAVLSLNNIDYNECVEITRFYTIPNAPKNSSSVLDKLVGRFLKQRGIKWMITSSMPAFSKTKAITVAGGMDIPLYFKECKFSFFKRKDNLWEMFVSRKRPKFRPIIESLWKLPPTFEFIKPLYKKGRSKRIKIFYVKKDERENRNRIKIFSRESYRVV